MKTTYRAEYIKCGKKTCKSCPHGPYWYGYYRQDGKLHKKYYGKLDPRDATRERKTRENHPHDDIYLRSKATVAIACAILELPKPFTKKQAKDAFRRLTKIHHPDKGGEEDTFKRINAAWTYIQSGSYWT